ncbi:Solvent efflux pump periplasmic linker SrpA [bacterium HR11]|nr:Solvent efflux pump periplasmic linker SrpA [bacterium HR11]
MRRGYMIGGIFLTAVVLAGLVGFMARSARSPASKAAPADPAVRSAVNVTVVPAELRAWPRIVEAVGTVAAWEQTEVAAQVDGPVTEVRKDVGDAVRAGEVLAKIDEREYELRYRQAEADAEQAARDLERAEQMARQGLIPPQQLEMARVRAQVARANADVARKKYEDTSVRAPYAGEVIQRLVSPGDYVRTGQPLFVLVDARRLRLKLPVPEMDYARIQPGQAVEVRFDALPGQTVTGRVYRVTPAIDPASRTVLVEVLVENADGRVRPGMFAHARLNLGMEAPMVTLPVSALQAVPGGVQKVYVVEGDTVRERQVEVAFYVGDRVVLRSGVRPGERVVAPVPPTIWDGMAVRIVSAPPEDALRTSPKPEVRP